MAQAHDYFCKFRSPVPFLSQMNPVDTIPVYFKSHFNIVLPLFKYVLMTNLEEVTRCIVPLVNIQRSRTTRFQHIKLLLLLNTSWNTRRCSAFKIKWKIKPNWTTNTTRLNSPRHSHKHTHNTHTNTHTQSLTHTHTHIQTRELNSANGFNGFNGLYRLSFWNAPFLN
jgi:hypothetical protein